MIRNHTTLFVNRVAFVSTLLLIFACGETPTETVPVGDIRAKLNGKAGQPVLPPRDNTDRLRPSRLVQPHLTRRTRISNLCCATLTDREFTHSELATFSPAALPRFPEAL